MEAGDTLMQDGPKKNGRRGPDAGAAGAATADAASGAARAAGAAAGAWETFLLLCHILCFFTPPDRLSNNILARICYSISRTSISASI